MRCMELHNLLQKEEARIAHGASSSYDCIGRSFRMIHDLRTLRVVSNSCRILVRDQIGYRHEGSHPNGKSCDTCSKPHPKPIHHINPLSSTGRHQLGHLSLYTHVHIPLPTITGIVHHHPTAENPTVVVAVADRARTDTDLSGQRSCSMSA